MTDAAAAAVVPKERTPRRRLVVGLTLLVVSLAFLGAAVVSLVPRNGQPLPEGERLRLLQQAGLPVDFPVHPEAQRMRQPPQGGFSYTLPEPVPLVLAWHQDSLERGGYVVYAADVPGQDEYLPHWLYFNSGSSGSGAIIIRASTRGLERGTEVKVLSRGDTRLIAPTLPPGLLPGR